MGRSIQTVIRSFLNPMHYKSIFRCHIYNDILDGFVRRYIMGRGNYPYVCALNTPAGVLRPTVYSHYDMFTIQEIFLWRCYGCRTDAKTIVDFGGNIGISALYFLSRNPNSFVYIFEPLTENIAKLKKNLIPYQQRYRLKAAAVANYEGSVSFGVEPTGRYSGIDLDVGSKIDVACVDANKALSEILSEKGSIDILKVDIEGAERIVFDSVKIDNLRRVSEIYIEGDNFDVDRLKSGGFEHEKQATGIHYFRNIKIHPDTLGHFASGIT